jgi:hypothetical protein
MGHGVGREFSQAFKWYTKAANQGYAPAQNNLGAMYRDGVGVNQDNAQAKNWFDKACENGQQESCNNFRNLNQN